MELKCAGCAAEGLKPAHLAEYMFRGTSVCEQHIRMVIRHYEDQNGPLTAARKTFGGDQ